MFRGVARSRARAVGSFVPTLTRKAFEKYGFSTATLLTEWSAIVGAELAAYTLPERLTWPKAGAKGEGTGEVSEAGERGRGGAKLVLRVDTARVLDVEYRKHQIIERINAHFGYRAVAELRFVQAPIKPILRGVGGMAAGAGQKPRDVVRAGAAGVPRPVAPTPLMTSTELPELDAALARLGASVRAGR